MFYWSLSMSNMKWYESNIFVILFVIAIKEEADLNCL
jgi:hypothetical protein